MKSTTLKAFVLGVSLSATTVLAAPPDGLITTKAKLALWTSDVRSSKVHVDTEDGVITLSGKVNTEEQKTLAEQKAKEIDGVRQVKNYLQIVPQGDEKRVERTDKETTDAIEKALKADASLNDSTITVKSVTKGVVLLGGEASSVSDHLRAVTLVDRLPGVRRVTSEVKSPDAFGNDERITFAPPARRDRRGEKRPAEQARSFDDRADVKKDDHFANQWDLNTTMAVKMKLLTTDEIPSNEIRVDSENGVVTLFGMVPTEAVKKTAGKQAQKVKGVTRVENELQVVASSDKKQVKAKDEDITRDLELAFKDKPAFKGITTNVKKGVVQLKGTVNSTWEEFSAVRTARSVKGVRNVEDDLKLDEKPRTNNSGS